jgi:hypothetical protein
MGVIRREAFYRNKIMSNAVPSAVHAIPSVTQKTRIANWSFESSSMMVKSIAGEWRFLMMRHPRLLKSVSPIPNSTG